MQCELVSLFTLLLTAASLSVATAQTEKGRWTAGVSVGSLSFQTNKDFNYKSFSGSLTPSVGYFIANNLLIGAGVPLSYSVNKAPNSYKSSSLIIGLSPYVRYYFGSSLLKPYIGATFGYNRSWSYYENPVITARAKGSSTSIVPTMGLAYFINRNIALNAGLNYNLVSSRNESLRLNPAVPPSPESRSDYKSLSLGIGFQLFFGK